jgi:hypothetical protein
MGFRRDHNQDEVMEVARKLTEAFELTREAWEIGMKNLKISSALYGSICRAGKNVQEASNKMNREIEFEFNVDREFLKDNKCEKTTYCAFN